MDMNIITGLDGDPGIPVVTTCPDTTDISEAVIALAGGEDKPFLVYGHLSFSTANGVDWDPTDAPRTSADPKVNQQAITAMLASPDYSKVWAL